MASLNNKVKVLIYSSLAAIIVSGVSLLIIIGISIAALSEDKENIVKDLESVGGFNYAEDALEVFDLDSNLNPKDTILVK
jgi:hypothetical protein